MPPLPRVRWVDHTGGRSQVGTVLIPFVFRAFDPNGCVCRPPNTPAGRRGYLAYGRYEDTHEP
eukprot:2378049-Prymnesium_polylepis.1